MPTIAPLAPRCPRKAPTTPRPPSYVKSANRLTMPITTTKRSARFASSGRLTGLALSGIVLLHPARPRIGGRTVIIRNQHAAGLRRPRVPGPGFVADAVRVGPIQERRNIVGVAVGSVIRFARLAEDQRHDLRDRPHARVETRDRIAEVFSVHVCLGNQLMLRIGRPRPQPRRAVII